MNLRKQIWIDKFWSPGYDIVINIYVNAYQLNCIHLNLVNDLHRKLFYSHFTQLLSSSTLA